MARNLVISPTPKQLAKRLGVAAKGMSDWRPAFRRLLPILVASESQHLSAASTNLAPLSPAYARRKRRAGGGRAVLHLTGALQADVDAGGRSRISQKKLSWGPKARYGYILNYGHPPHLPERPWITLDDAVEAKALELLQERAEQLMETAFSRPQGAGI